MEVGRCGGHPGPPLSRPGSRSRPTGATQLSLDRTESGHLRVGRRPIAPTALLEAIELRGGDAHLTLLPPGGLRPGTHLLLLDAERPDARPAAGDRARRPRRGLVGAADLPAGYFGVVRLALGTEHAWVRIRRRGNDLADPHRAVLLPELHDGAAMSDADEDAPRARFRWNPDVHARAPGPRPRGPDPTLRRRSPTSSCRPTRWAAPSARPSPRPTRWPASTT